MSETIDLQPDDHELIRLLGGTFLMLDDRQVGDLFPHRSPRAFKERRVKLVRAGYLNLRHPDEIARPGNHLYYLGPAGQKVLDPESRDPKIVSRIKKARSFSDADLAHLYLANWIQIKFMAARQHYSDFELVSWIPQYAPLWLMLNRHGLSVRPDGFARYAKNSRTFHAFIEVDRNTYRSELHRKFEGYYRYAQSGRSSAHLSAPHFRVLFVTISRSRVKALLRLASSYPADLFWITTVENFFAKPLFEPCWRSPSSSCLHGLDEPTEPLPLPPDPPSRLS